MFLSLTQHLTGWSKQFRAVKRVLGLVRAVESTEFYVGYEYMLKSRSKQRVCKNKIKRILYEQQLTRLGMP